MVVGAAMHAPTCHHHHHRLAAMEEVRVGLYVALLPLVVVVTVNLMVGVAVRPARGSVGETAAAGPGKVRAGRGPPARSSSGPGKTNEHETR